MIKSSKKERNQITIKFLRNVMEWLHIIQVPTDFGGNPDLDPDQGIFKGILSLLYWQL